MPSTTPRRARLSLAGRALCYLVVLDRVAGFVVPSTAPLQRVATPRSAADGARRRRAPAMLLAPELLGVVDAQHLDAVATALAATPPVTTSAVVPDLMTTLPTSTLAAITTTTCVDDAGWWCTVQNGVQGLIESLHGFIAGPLGVKQNAYGASIILFTLFCRTLTYPLNYLSYESGERVKALKPYMDQIKERYGDDANAVNLATAKLYDLTKTNPLAGCLPSLAQIPVFIALYRSILNLAFEDKINEPFLWLPSLEGPTYAAGRGLQWIAEGWVDGVPSLGWHDTLCFAALPAALVVTQSISMRILTPPADPKDEGAMRTQRILKYLPLIIGYFAMQTPSGLGLYWMTSNVYSVATSAATKAYLKANPPSLNIDLRELGLDDGSAGVKIPATIEEALADAKVNARPSRAPRRAGVEPLALFSSAIVAEAYARGGLDAPRDHHGGASSAADGAAALELSVVADAPVAVDVVPDSSTAPPSEERVAAR